jgi:hypothetical protein
VGEGPLVLELLDVGRDVDEDVGVGVVVEPPGGIQIGVKAPGNRLDTFR